MLVAVLTGPDLAYYHNLTRLSPVPFVVPPILWLSKPEENVGKDVIRHLEDEGSNVQVQLIPAMFRHLFNPNSGITSYYAAMSSKSPLIQFRKELQILEYTDTFIPYMLICQDGMRTRSVKQFCVSLANQLVSKIMTFEVFYADENNPEHKTIFENYNAETQEAFGNVCAYAP